MSVNVRRCVRVQAVGPAKDRAVSGLSLPKPKASCAYLKFSAGGTESTHGSSETVAAAPHIGLMPSDRDVDQGQTKQQAGTESIAFASFRLEVESLVGPLAVNSPARIDAG